MGARKSTARLLVDGYNIIGAWPSFTKRVIQQSGFEDARRELTEVLINYSASKSYDTYLVVLMPTR
jgi:predicted RNA-binding protein with PIN domain